MSLAINAINTEFGIFKKKYDKLTPYVQHWLKLTDKEDLMHLDILRYLESIHNDVLHNPLGYYPIKDHNEREIKVPLNILVPNSRDVAYFFIQFLKGVQFVADQYDLNPTMDLVPCYSSDMQAIEGCNALMSYHFWDGISILPSSFRILNLNNTLLINLDGIYEAKAKGALTILSKDDTIPDIFFRIGPYLTMLGVEEAHHHILWTNPEILKQECGLTRQEYIDKRLRNRGKPIDYEEDEMEVAATKMKVKAIDSNIIIGSGRPR